MRIFVTGGSRGIGACIVKDQRARGNEVVAPPRNEFDLTKPLPNMGKFDAIIHCASETNGPDDVMWDTNVKGTKNLMMWAAITGAKHIVLMSTGNMLIGIDNVYTRSKDAQELATALGAYANNMHLHTIRPYFPYGPGTNPRRKIMKLVLDAFHPVTKRMRVDSHTINPIYIDDLVGIVNKTLQKQGDTVMNCGGPDDVCMTMLAEMIVKKVGGKHVVDTDEDELVAILGQRVGTTSPSDGLDKTIAWIRKELI